MQILYKLPNKSIAEKSKSFLYSGSNIRCSKIGVPVGQQIAVRSSN